MYKSTYRSVTCIISSVGINWSTVTYFSTSSYVGNPLASCTLAIGQYCYAMHVCLISSFPHMLRIKRQYRYCAELCDMSQWFITNISLKSSSKDFLGHISCWFRWSDRYITLGNNFQAWLLWDILSLIKTCWWKMKFEIQFCLIERDSKEEADVLVTWVCCGKGQVWCKGSGSSFETVIFFISRANSNCQVESYYPSFEDGGLGWG